MGGFTGLFDRPDPYVTSLTKNRNLQVGINATGGDWTAARNATQGGLGDYIRKYLANQGDSEKYAGQETGAINRFYNGDMAAQLAALRAKRSSVVNAAADVGVNQALRNVDLSRVGGEGGSSSYDKRLAIGAVTPIRTQAALDNATQERADTDYLTGNQIALSGARSGIADRLAGRALVPGQASFSSLKDETGGMAPVVGLDQSNKYYGIKQDPGLLDRMQQEVQFLQGLQSIMKNQYGTVSEAGTGWAGGGMGGGGGGGGMGGMMGGMGGMGMRRGGMVGHNYVDHITDYTNGGGVEGPGSGTSDSIPARLSNGEFVVPARAVRMPGVLALLEKIRAMGNEGPTTARMAGGGLYYADSFGDLGHQALARDAFNESVVGGQVQQIQQQGQFDQSLAQRQAEQQGQQRQQTRQQTDTNNRSSLNYYGMRGEGQTSSGGYDSTGYMGTRDPGSPFTFARGGYVTAQMPYWDRARSLSDIHSGESSRAHPQPMPYKGKFAHGGMVGYAAGGPVDPDEAAYQESSRNLAQAVKDARERAQRGQSMTTADVNKQRMDMEDRRLQMNKDYQDWLMKQPTAQDERKNALTFKYGEEAAGRGEDVSDVDLPPEQKAILGKISDSQAGAIDSMHKHAGNLADLLNQQKMIDETEPRLKAIQSQNSRTLIHEFLTPQQKEAYKNASDQLADNAERKTAITRILQPYQKDLGALVTYDPMQDQYVSAIKPAPVRKNRAIPAAAGAAPNSAVNQGPQATEPTEHPTAMRSASTAQPTYAPKFPPQFYSRVNQLAGSGMEARQAKSQAMMEMQEAR